MDNITGFFKEFKSRLSNPLFFSFIISWLIINWRVPAGIIGYKLDELKVDGYTSYTDLIAKNASTWNYLWHPLLYAIGYTFLFPIVRMFIVAFLNFIKKRSDNWNTEIMKDYYVPMSRFVKQKQKYDELAEALNKIYLEDNKTNIDNAELKQKIMHLNNELNIEKNKEPAIKIELSNLKKEHEREMYFNKVDSIAGRWQMTWHNPTDDNKEKITVIFQDNTISILTSVVSMPWGKIISYGYNIYSGEITVVLDLQQYNSLIDEHKLGPKSMIDVHKVQLGFRGPTDRITDMEGYDLRGKRVIYSRIETEI